MVKARRIVAFTIAILCGFFSGSSFAEDSSYAFEKRIPQTLKNIDGVGQMPELMAETAVLIDANSGQVLYNKNMHEKKYPASTTKILTGLLAIENLDAASQVVVDHEASYTEGSRIYLLEGEEVTVEELMYAMMLASANDAAIALAKTMAGSVESFAVMMNERAKQAGAQNSHFTNPNGLPDEAHVTTAYDLAMIAKATLQYDSFRKYVGTVRYDMRQTNMQDARILNNGNRLLYDTTTKLNYDGVTVNPKYEGTIGLKTGYTVAAGNCLVAAVERDGRTLIGVVMQSDSPNVFLDMIKLFDYGFTNYDTKIVVTVGNISGTVNIKKGMEESLDVITSDSIALTVPVGTSWGEITTEVELPETIQAPLKVGEAVGSLKVYYDGEVFASIPLVTGIAVEERATTWLDVVAGVIKVLVIIAVCLAVSFVLFILLINFLYKRKKERSRLRKEARRREKVGHLHRELQNYRYVVKD